MLLVDGEGQRCGVAAARPRWRGKVDDGFLTKDAAQIWDQLQEDRQMWFYVQMWLPLLTIGLTAAICLSVVSFMMGQPKPQP